MINKKNEFINEDTQCIFIVGNQRSGTTLISRLFDGHHQILSLIGETNFFTQMDQRDNLEDVNQKFFYLNGGAFDYSTGKRQIFGTKVKQGENWQQTVLWESIVKVSKDIEQDEEILKNAIQLNNKKDIFLTLARIYKKYYWPHKNNPKYILEKTPENEFYIDKIFKLFPKAKIIHIIRDPFDVIESILRIKEEKKREKRLVSYVFIWKRSLQAGLKYYRKYPNNYCFLKFENLLNDTERVIKKLANFLEINFDYNLLKPTNHSGADLWESHTHQKIKVNKGVVDSRLLKKDSSNELSEEFMNIIGRFVGSEYKLFKWDKYSKYISNNFFTVIFGNYPNKNFKEHFKYIIKYILSIINNWSKINYF